MGTGIISWVLELAQNRGIGAQNHFKLMPKKAKGASLEWQAITGRKGCQGEDEEVYSLSGPVSGPRWLVATSTRIYRFGSSVNASISNP